MPATAKPEEGLAATRLQLEQLVEAVSTFLGDYGWYILGGCLLVLWAQQAVGPWLREQANQRAIRCVNAFLVSLCYQGEYLASILIDRPGMRLMIKTI